MYIDFYFFKSFKPAQILPRVGPKIIETMAQEIKYMMDAKISAVRVCILNFDKLKKLFINVYPI